MNWQIKEKEFLAEDLEYEGNNGYGKKCRLLGDVIGVCRKTNPKTKRKKDKTLDRVEQFPRGYQCYKSCGVE